MLLEIENAIVKRISDAVTDETLRVKAFPEKLSQLNRPISSGQILVAYSRSTFNYVSAAPDTFDWRAEFEISVHLKDLRTHTGAYPLLDLVRSALTGFVPFCTPYCKGIFPITERFIDLDSNGVWYYSMTFYAWLLWYAGISAPQIADPDPTQADGWELLQIKSGIWRSKDGSLPTDLSQSVLDRTIVIDAEQP